MLLVREFKQLGECVGIHGELGLIGCKSFKKVSHGCVSYWQSLNYKLRRILSATKSVVKSPLSLWEHNNGVRTVRYLKADWRMDAELPAVMWLVYHWFHLENSLQLALISGCHLKCHYLLTVCRARREYGVLPVYLEREDFLCLIKDRTNWQAAPVEKKRKEKKTLGVKVDQNLVPQQTTRVRRPFV